MGPRTQARARGQRWQRVEGKQGRVRESAGFADGKEVVERRRASTRRRRKKAGERSGKAHPPAARRASTRRFEARGSRTGHSGRRAEGHHHHHTGSKNRRWCPLARRQEEVEAARRPCHCCLTHPCRCPRRSLPGTRTPPGVRHWNRSECRLRGHRNRREAHSGRLERQNRRRR